MDTLLSSGLVVDLILGLVILEALLLFAYWRRSRRGIAPAAVVFNLASGAFLLLALRSVLVDASPGWTAGWLAAALLAHLLDLRSRWRN